MSAFNINIPGGESKRLKTGGKYCPADIVVTAEGSVPVVEKDVNFYDYDGTLLYAYTLEEAQALTELPPGPDWHEHLIFDCWNWTLEEVVSVEEPADIGALYDTEDRATFIKVTFYEPLCSTVKLNFSGTPNIDWGDGTQDTAASTGITHNYASAGTFEIKITGAHTLGGGTDSTPIVSDVAARAVTQVFVGKNTTCRAYCFFCMFSLKTVAYRKSANYLFEKCYSLRAAVCYDDYIRVSQFRDCYSLVMLCTPKKQVGLQSQALRGCRALRRLRNPYRLNSDQYILMECSSLEEVCIAVACAPYTAHSCYSAQKITIKEGITSIGQLAFYNCVNSQSILIASTVTNIGAQAFHNCTTVRRMVFHAVTPPTVANANAFTGINASCVIEVPAESLEAYKNATNYSSIAARMVGV